MKLEDAKDKAEDGRHWRYVQSLSVLIPFILSTSFCLTFYKQIHPEGGQLALSLTLSAVNLILAGAYFYTYKHFADKFYFFIAVAWLSTAVNLILDVNGPTQTEHTHYKFGIYLLSLVPNVFLLLALIYRGSTLVSRHYWVIIRIVIAVLMSIGIFYVFITHEPNDIYRRLALWMIPGSLLSFVLLCAVGDVLKGRFGEDDVGRAEKILRNTFYAYAFLQLFYPLTANTLVVGTNWILSLYLVAQIVKVANTFALLGAMQLAITANDAKLVREQAVFRMKVADLQALEAKLQGEKQLVELGALAAGIKHDINTPLATMSFELGALKDIYQDDKRITKRLERLEESMERIYAIIKIVDIIRGDQSLFAHDQFMNKASMLEIVHRAVRAVKNEIGVLKQPDAKTNIQVEGRDVWVRAYAPMFEQVIVNIIKNSLEAIEEAERERGVIRINVNMAELVGQKPGRWAKVEIEDNGIGIPEENRDKLVTLFTTKEDKKPNSGNGLFLGKRIVDIHGGSINFNSELGNGTKVTLLLPEWNALQKG